MKRPDIETRAGKRKFIRALCNSYRYKLKRTTVDGLDCYAVYRPDKSLAGYVRKRWNAPRRCYWGHALPDEDDPFIYDCVTRAEAVAALIGWQS